MSEIPRQLTTDELHQCQAAIAEADQYNIFCHCRECGSFGVARMR